MWFTSGCGVSYSRRQEATRSCGLSTGSCVHAGYKRVHGAINAFMQAVNVFMRRLPVLSNLLVWSGIFSTHCTDANMRERLCQNTFDFVSTPSFYCRSYLDRSRSPTMVNILLVFVIILEYEGPAGVYNRFNTS